MNVFFICRDHLTTLRQKAAAALFSHKLTSTHSCIPAHGTQRPTNYSYTAPQCLISKCSRHIYSSDIGAYVCMASSRAIRGRRSWLSRLHVSKHTHAHRDFTRTGAYAVFSRTTTATNSLLVLILNLCSSPQTRSAAARFDWFQALCDWLRGQEVEHVEPGAPRELKFDG